MSDAAINIAVRFKVLTCCHAGCGVTFAVPDWWENGRRESHDWWYCPNGHAQHFTAKTDAEKLREQLAREKETSDWNRRRLETEMKSHAATRGQMTKLKNRVGNGVCPCCNRTFANLARHVKSKHPDFQEQPRHKPAKQESES